MEQSLIFTLTVSLSFLLAFAIILIRNSHEKKRKQPSGLPVSPLPGNVVYLNKLLYESETGVTLTIMPTGPLNSSIQLSAQTTFSNCPNVFNTIVLLSKGSSGTKCSIALRDEIPNGSFIIDCRLIDIKPADLDVTVYVDGKLEIRSSVKINGDSLNKNN